MASDGELWVSKVLYGIVTLEKDITHVTRLGPGDEAHVEAALRDRTLEVMEKLRDVGAVLSSIILLLTDEPDRFSRLGRNGRTREKGQNYCSRPPCFTAT